MQGLQPLLLQESLPLKYPLVIGMLFAGCLLLPVSLLLDCHLREYPLVIGMLFAEYLLLPETLLLGYLLLVGIPSAECLELPEALPPESLLVKSLSVARLPAEKLSQPEPLVMMLPLPRFQTSMGFRRLGPALRRGPRSPVRHILVFVDNGQPIPQRSMLFSCSWDTRDSQSSRIGRYLLPAERFAQAEALTKMRGLGVARLWLGFGNLACPCRGHRHLIHLIHIVVPAGDGQLVP